MLAFAGLGSIVARTIIHEFKGNRDPIVILPLLCLIFAIVAVLIYCVCYPN